MARPRKINEKNIYIKPALQEVLDKVEDYPVTFISAPAGYGKTTLVSYLGKTRKVLSFIINSENSDSFRQDFIDVVGDIGTWKTGSDSGSVCIVIENVHELDDTKMLDIIYALASEQDSLFRFVLTSRINYYTERSPEVINGHVNLAGAQMLLLDRSEIISYFGACGIRIDAEMADQIYNRTGGCMNVLFNVLRRYIYTGKLTFTDETADHIYQTQLRYLTPIEETIGNRLALMGRFTLYEAEVMMDRIKKEEFLEQRRMPDLSQLLASLCRKNYFIYYDAVEGKYIFNVLFRNKLMDIYRENYPEELEVMQEIVADVHYEVGDFALAAYYYLLCEDHEKMFVSIAKDNGISVERDNREAYIRFYRASSRSVRSKHHLAVLYLAWRFFNYGEMDLYKEASGEFLEDLFADESITEDQRRSLLCDYYLFSGMTGYYDLDRMLLQYKNAYSMFDGIPRNHHTVFPRTFGSISIMRVIYNRGSMGELIKTIREIAAIGNVLLDNKWKGFDTATEAEACFLKMELEDAKILIEKAVRECREIGSPHGGTMVALSFLKGQIALLEGDAISLRREIFEAGVPDSFSLRSELSKTMELCQAWIFVQLGMYERIEEWIKAGRFSEVRLMYPALPAMHLVYIYVQLALGKYTKVLSYEEYFYKSGDLYDNLIIREEACMIFAAAALEIGKLTAARKYFDEALDIAAKTENHASIVFYGERLIPLFGDVHEKHREMAISLLKKIRGFVEIRKRVISKLDTVRFMGLTEREMQAARLVTVGRTNKEIAKELSISENTVKSTLKRVFSKLNINSRRQLSDMVRKYDLM